MGFSLAPAAVQKGYGLEVFETVGSTNAVALEAARQGETGPKWFVTDCQTQGRGRRGRAWQDAKGNLAATLLVVNREEPARAATLGFVAGVALMEALEALIPEGAVRVAPDSGELAGGAGRFTLKWPNDVTVEGAKLSGILLESSMLGDHRLAIAIGIGVNVVSHPNGLPYSATSLKAVGAKADAGQVFEALSDAWAEAYDVWAGPSGLAEIRRRWLRRAAGTGSQVAVRIGQHVLRGVFETIDDDCQFVIRGEDGKLKRIAAGDVHFGAIATTASG